MSGSFGGRLGSSLASCLQPLDDFTRSDDGDALMAADGQQMLAIPGDDQLGSRGHGRRDDGISIGICIVSHIASPKD